MRRNLLLCSTVLALISVVAIWWALLLTAYSTKRVGLGYGYGFSPEDLGGSYYTEIFSRYPDRYLLKSVFADLIAKTTDELYILKSLDNACSDTSGIDCYGLDNSKVKPLIPDALVFRQTTEAARMAASSVSVLTTSAAIGFLSLLVSIGALAVSFFTLQTKRHNPDDN